MQIKRMWQGGPLRWWSEKECSKTPMFYDGGGYVGVYVCDGLLDAPSHDSPHGLYQSPDGLWRCAEHREQAARNGYSRDLSTGAAAQDRPEPVPDAG